MYEVSMPSAVRTAQTENLNMTHQAIGQRLRLERLLFVFGREAMTDEEKVFWLESFGVSGDLIESAYLGDAENLIKLSVAIKQQSGTTIGSVKRIALALGATDVDVKKVSDYRLRYDGLTVGLFGADNTNTKSSHQGYYIHDAGEKTNKYLVDVRVNFNGDFNDFKSRFKNIFFLTQPLRASVRKIERK